MIKPTNFQPAKRESTDKLLIVQANRVSEQDKTHKKMLSIALISGAIGLLSLLSKRRSISSFIDKMSTKIATSDKSNS